MDALLKSLVRTAIPVVVGVIVTLGLRAGVDLHGYGPELTAGVTFVFYALVRLAEQYVSEHFGWLLGVAARPVYPPPAKVRRDSGHGDIITVLVVVLLVLVILLVAGVIR